MILVNLIGSEKLCEENVIAVKLAENTILSEQDNQDGFRSIERDGGSKK